MLDPNLQPPAPPASPPPASPPPARPPMGDVTPPAPPGDFVVPDEYKDSGMAGKVKSYDELWKQAVLLDKTVGKKVVSFDYDNATEEEREAHMAAIRPQDKAVYDFFDESIPEAERTAYQDIFHKYALPKSIAEGLTTEVQALRTKQMEQALSKEGFVATMQTIYGEDYQKDAGQAAALIKSMLPAESQSILDQSVPNDLLGIFYQFASGVIAKYGADERGLSLQGKPGGSAPADMDKTRSEIRQKIRDLSSRPHTLEEKNSLQNQLAATYK